MKRKNYFIISVLLVMLNISPARELTLSDCIEIAVNNKETILSAQLDVQAARAGKMGSFSNILPAVNLTGGRTETSFANNTIYPDNTTWAAGVSVYQNIFDGGGWWNRIAQADNHYKIQQQLERQTNINVIAEVNRAYYQLLKNQALVEVAEQNVELAVLQVELTQKRYDLGSAKKTDLLKTQVALGSAKTLLINQQTLLQTSLSDLYNAMGILGKDEALNISRDIEAIQSVPNFSKAVETMKHNNPGILVTESYLKDAEINKKLINAKRLPSLGATLSYQGVDSKFSGLNKALTDEWTMTAGLNLSFPIFNGLAMSTQSQQAKLNVQKQKYKLDITIKDAIVNLESIYNNVKNFHEIIPLSEEVLSAAEEDMRLVGERYRLGTVTILELLDAQVSVTRSRSDLVSSIYDAKIQEAYLHAQLGILDKIFVKTLNNNQGKENED